MRLRLLGALGALAVLAALLLTVSASGASTASELKSYIVVMKLNPVVAYEGGVAGIPATKPDKGEKVNTRSVAARRYAEYLGALHDDSLAAAGVSTSKKINDYTVALNGYSALLTPEQAERIGSQKNVVRVMEDELQQPATDSSGAFLGLTDRGGAYAHGYNGRGVVVGVIDTGVWPEHPSFADDGSYPAPTLSRPVPCQFGNTAHNANDKPFTCNNKLVGARDELATYRAQLGAESWEFRSARDDNGHGTHTSSTAAGNANVPAQTFGIPRGRITGIAYRAHVIMYKGLGAQGGFTSDLVRAINDAVADGVDVINYSIGGGASLTGGDDIAFLFANDAGVFVAASAGNSGPGAATIGGPGSVPWLTTVGANTQRRVFQGTVVLGNGQSYTGVSMTDSLSSKPLIDAAAPGVAGGATPDLCVSGTLNPAAVANKIVLCRRGGNARVDKSFAVLLAGGAGMILYENSNAGDLMSDPHFVPSVHVDNTPGLAVKSYIASTATPTARLDNKQLGSFSFAPSTTQFSSRGPDPVAQDIIKPDITAPGIQILAGNTPFPGPPGAAPAGELFQAIAGTSMSSPHIAGLFALLKQAHPDWSASAAKSALMTSAAQNVKDNDRINPATPFLAGAGHANIGKPTEKGSAFQPGLVYDAGFNEYLGFLCDADPSAFANPAATCAALAGAGIPTRAVDLNLASIGVSQLAGAETIKRTVTNVGNSTVHFFANVNAPAGYTVDVNPSSLSLKAGESQTFEVTITNVSAPIGEWRFGSLSWSAPFQGSVRSPIAVKASKFSAPAEINGSGATGTASFQVKFGYTGAYAAVPSGLTAATLTNANVKQDPNQTFAPSDVGNGATLHTFNLADTAVFRVAIPPEATEPDADLDVYVYNPSNQLVAASTLGGTDEEVTIQSPANGAWKVYVHGWQAPGGDSDYTLYSWAVPNATGGSLQVTSAPTSATIGATGTVNLSWSGAGGTWNLGAVTHKEGATTLGRTLVEVDNRP